MALGTFAVLLKVNFLLRVKFQRTLSVRAMRYDGQYGQSSSSLSRAKLPISIIPALAENSTNLKNLQYSFIGCYWLVSRS